MQQDSQESIHNFKAPNRDRKLICMSTRYLALLAALIVIGIGSRSTVKAGAPSNAASSIAGLTVKGVVKFEGKRPAPSPIRMAADPSCAKQHGVPALTQEVMTDVSGGLQNAIVYISDGLGDRTFSPPHEAVVIDQKGCLYQPHVLAMQTNQPLEVVNDDNTTHNIHPVPANNREWNKAEPPGAKTEETFAREEIAIPVKCNIHPWMRGYVAVFKHPYFAVTSKDGTFDLKNLPPGTYTIKAWHEKLGTASQTVTVGSNETRNIEFVFKSPSGT
jgi:plastocyanin